MVRLVCIFLFSSLAWATVDPCPPNLLSESGRGHGYRHYDMNAEIDWPAVRRAQTALIEHGLAQGKRVPLFASRPGLLKKKEALDAAQAYASQNPHLMDLGRRIRELLIHTRPEQDRARYENAPFVVAIQHGMIEGDFASTFHIHRNQLVGTVVFEGPTTTVKDFDARGLSEPELRNRANLGALPGKETQAALGELTVILDPTPEEGPGVHKAPTGKGNRFALFVAIFLESPH